MKKSWFLIPLIIFSLMFNSHSINAETTVGTGLHEQNTMSVLWFQKSAEAKALYYQGYNIGKMRLDEYLNQKQKKSVLKPAVVLDIDETILDNSPYLAWNVISGDINPFDWSKWFNRAEAKLLPGALDFLKYADSKGVAIFYISNRFEAQKAATLKNLQMVGAPQAEKSHILLMQPGEKGKEYRRQTVAKTHEIVLLFGDNLGDFNGFEMRSVSGRLQAAERAKNEFGKKFILFPNPMYGDWEEILYNYDYKKSDEEKVKLRKANLEPK